MAENRRVSQIPLTPLTPATAQQQREVLGRAVQLLACAADFDAILRQTIAACLPAVGDFGFFDAVVAPGEVRRTVAAHQAPQVEALLAPTRWVAQHHPELNLCALSTGEAALHPAIDEGWYRRIAFDDEHLALLRALAFRSMLTVPVRYRGELVGALTLFMGASGRRHSPDDLALASELALLAAPVVVNARLVQQHERVEAALRHSEERLRMAMDAGQVGIWDWDIVRNQVSWSARVYEMHELPVGADTGGYEGFRSRVHPDDWPRVQGAMQDALAGGAPYEVEFRTLLPGGGLRWISTRSQLVLGADGRPVRMVGASIDTTERTELLAAERRARDDAEAARRRLELLASASSALALSLDTEDTLRTIAQTLVPAIADWCRIDLLDDSGRQHRRISYHRDAERARQALEMAQQLQVASQIEGSMAWCIARREPYYGRFDAPPASEHAALRQFHETFGMHAYYVVPLIARGRTLGGLRVMQAESGRDLTPEDRALVMELGRRAALALDNAHAYAEAEAARRQAEAASRAKDEFLAMLGHELRNPLAPIANALELMARRDPASHLEERRIIGRQVAHLSRLIDDLRDVSRITQGKVELQRQPVDMRVIVAHALEQTQPVFERRAQAPAVALPAQPAWVSGDVVRLTQVLCNLLINAAKFTPPDGRVELRVQTLAGWVEVAVQDSGRGIAPQLLPQVFDLFVQGRQSLDRQTGGLGLGLAIVRMLVEMHGGSVSAASDGEGCGSCFTVRLPAIEDRPGVPEEPAASRATPASGGLRLLVVDDNVDAGETLAELLRVLGFEVRCAPDGESALALLENYRPHLGLLDIGLPGLDGYQLASMLRADARTRDMRLVALTGYGTEADRARALASGFDEHLVKPAAADRLFETLERLLGVRF
jgi:signal transduction histidine kinase/PAS domain-containing protein